MLKKILMNINYVMPLWERMSIFQILYIYLLHFSLVFFQLVTVKTKQMRNIISM